MADGSKFKEIYELDLQGSRSRIRLSPIVLEELGWSENQQDFECHGVFRTTGEFIVAPTGLKNSEGVHPFQAVADSVEDPGDEALESIKDIPSAIRATARVRLPTFPATWSRGRKQLDLKVGTAVTEKLGWDRDPPTPIMAKPWRRALLLMSKDRYDYAQSRDFTNGLLNLGD